MVGVLGSCGGLDHLGLVKVTEEAVIVVVCWLLNVPATC